jgi:hypothetical protein
MLSAGIRGVVVAQALTTYQMTFWVIPSPQTVPFFRIERNSLPLAMERFRPMFYARI